VQTTLLGLGIAVILALVAALAGPFLIDWNRFRPMIEAEASQFIGAPVRITGPIAAALLPIPALTLHGIELRPSDSASRIRARSLSVEFSLGSLVRGEWRAAEMHLVGPEFDLGINASGGVTWPKFAGSFDPDALSIDRLNIEDGRAVLSDARSGSRLVFDKLRFNGELRSLIGPLKGDGAFVIAGEPHAYRITAGRLGDEGVKLRIKIDPTERPLTIEADGLLVFEQGEPRFEGSLNIARLPGLALASGKTLVSDPWRLNALMKATTAAALLQQMEFRYGPEERAVKLTGAAEVKFGSKPRFDGVLSAGHADLDRAFVAADAGRKSPLAAIKALAASSAGAWRPSIPVRLGIGIDALTFAGGTVQTLRGDIASDGEAWSLDGFEFRAPGVTQVNLSGRLDLTAAHLGFIGPVSVDSSDPSALVAWLEGAGQPGPGRMKPLRARGDIALADDKLAIDRLSAEIDRKTVQGRLVYTWAAADHPARLDADLKAAELDLDALLAFAYAARDGAAFETPREITLGIDIDRATLAGVDIRNVSAWLRHDAKGLKIERFSIADLGGAAINASGQIETKPSAPRGKIILALEAKDFAGVAALAAKFAPATAEPLRSLAADLLPTKLNAVLSLDGTEANTTAKLAIEGRAGGTRLSLLGEATRNAADAGADLQALMAGNLRLEGKAEADDGGVLVRMLKLGKLVVVDKRPGQFHLMVEGPLTGALRVEGRLLAGGLDVSSKGTMQLRGEDSKADLRLLVATADLQPLRGTAAKSPAAPLPVTLTGNLAVAGSSLKLEDFSGTFAGLALRGRLGFVLSQPLRVEGRIEAETIEASAVIAAAIGMPPQGPARTDTWAWSSEPFAQGLFEDIDGRIEFTAARATFTPMLVLRQARGVAKFSRSEIAFTDIEGGLADGKITAQLVFDKNVQGLSARGRVRLIGAKAAALLSGDSKDAVDGRLGLNIDIEGAGLSPRGLIGSLAGNGTVSLERGQFARLNPKAFDAAARAADQGMTTDSSKIGDIVNAALHSGHLGISSAEGVITIDAGQVRLANTVAQAEGADLTMTGNVDLIEGNLNTRLTLAGNVGTPASAADRPVVFVSLRGPLGAPRRSVDMSALTAWLTLRAIEQQSKQLEAIEAGRSVPVVGRPADTPRPTPPVPRVDRPPPLPPPIDISPAPGAADRAPARNPAQVQTGPVVAPKPLTPKPAPMLPPPPRRPPLDLSASPDN
jgi:large subunit ribosomal protein L24